MYIANSLHGELSNVAGLYMSPNIALHGAWFYMVLLGSALEKKSTPNEPWGLIIKGLSSPDP